ncbi:ABC transporter ATP-binding protein [Corynebacterium sp. MC-04]|uniref:ABC transporter ATP-binding protein n=1 Tax=Corynebacterium parakroppenstedtii TaxID=2828363 RepID=A0ABS9HP40_9CORY|nr:MULTISPECIES: ABC transporter ATP-binding protein [Corynebacterium]KXB49812.1 ABC transporter, ATP-binding protein [Corynebacterium kroppenstedtii]MBY0789557.1 ABC transporter ATP-binding protein [Corynebacterium parakroppenstedtii]MBY0793719.1 ABC transporter ATP-binding protein [Corynebacterium parakroppenstedtii]MBY0797031.1 ABC transporter ATP-binding protein [Corynebacterium parakroppenstedtii]MCF6770531.1 ABC transporter ATP-binding protein [Corynebacterium parakroppenstedtii]
MSSTPAGTNAPIARADAISKYYGKGDTRVTALDSVSVEFRTGEFTAIMGPSGSGKSTLMHCMAGLDSISEGSTFVGDTDLSTLNDKQLTRLRRDRIGFVFQSFNLVPTLTASENITLPMDIGGHRVDKEWFTHIVTAFGLTSRLDHRPSELSGGQQQRVACARALIGRPDIIFGDEPTGNLDSNSSTEVLTTLRSVVDEYNQTVVIVTHDPRAASYADRVIFLTDGHIVDELTNPTTESILTTMATIDNPDNQAS